MENPYNPVLTVILVLIIIYSATTVLYFFLTRRKYHTTAFIKSLGPSIDPQGDDEFISYICDYAEKEKVPCAKNVAYDFFKENFTGLLILYTLKTQSTPYPKGVDTLKVFKKAAEAYCAKQSLIKSSLN